MNELHLQYKMETGITISKQVKTLSDIRLGNLHKLYDYIKWLEEQIDEKNKLLNIAIDLIPDTNEKDKIKFDKHSKHYHDRGRNR